MSKNHYSQDGKKQTESKKIECDLLGILPQ
jgi:hypothetical protein